MKVSRNTVAKKEIADLLQRSEKAVSHAEIMQELNGLCDRVTIYRVLDRLVDEGAVHKVVNIDGVVRYAACQHCTTKHIHNHLHFNCEKCKTVSCLEGVEPVYKLPKNYLVNDANFMLSGTCPNCIEK